MSWFFLILAGLLETGWAVGLKAIAEKPNIAIIAVTTFFLVASMACLTLAMRNLPLGISYPVWTGIGSVGSIIFGVLVFNENLQLGNIAGAGLIILGILLVALNSH
ncbi:MAG: hypothetical protein GVY36_19520 [Verrucomicrobia bacterium]|jgi:quaternary ammonium compound-resistance protein SugE|nr:hypothetical protein [Verrucomicrobiota bacterium]